MRDERGAEIVWNVLEGEVVGKKMKEGKKEKKVKGTCVEEVVGKKRKEGNKEKKIKGTCVEEKKRGKKNKKEISTKKIK